ncbi:MAG TPA: tRNA (adenosine(37)-N6)-threonylcarbamoyltransferase complex ATPase subunit type 1 TsaE [Sphingobacteriaceae bacterium]|nr:tRNA (adenosine(37)-N6)-threonylcarbamoyltransferase complex ATPase subunit type 1 TsaE [Sphingobacteriaceae bacterium]
MEFEVSSLNRLPQVADKLLDYAADERIFLFEGEMGTGKTTFIKTLCDRLNINEVASSPTFSIVNEYSSEKGPIYHFDFYRLKNETEAFDLGYEDYFYSGYYCFIEWPEKIPNLWPEKYISVQITETQDHKRLIKAEHIIKS